MPARNSNLEAWTAFARRLDPTRFMPVFVPDLEQTLNGQLQALQGHAVLGEAAWNLGLRMALYERSYISLGVNTGPMGLCWLNARTHYATLKMAPETCRRPRARSTSSLASSRNARCLLQPDAGTGLGGRYAGRHPTRIRPHRRAHRGQVRRMPDGRARRPLDNAPGTS